MTVMALSAPARLRASARPLPLVDLLNDLDELIALLHAELEDGSAINAFLLAAGITQVTEDYLYSDRALVLKAADHLARSGGLAGKVGSAGIRALDTSRRAARRIWGGDELAHRWLVHVHSLVDALAPLVLAGEEEPGWRNAMSTRARPVFAGHLELPRKLRRSIIRLPSCFRSFDQQPNDMEALARKLASEQPGREAPVAVVGVRTSGSYLAPLVAAALVRLGFGDVTWLTVRPGSPLGRAQARILRRLARGEGTVALVDDPPTTGGSLERAASTVSDNGVREDAIVLLLAVARDPAGLPDAIRRRRAVVLPWDEWSIVERLQPDAVGRAMSSFLPARLRIVSVERVTFVPGTGREHASGRFRLTAVNVDDGAKSVLDVHASGAGVGYFGEHSLAVARQLPRFSPRVYGIADGVVFRDWLPGAKRLDGAVAAADPRLPSVLVDYVTARHAALRVPDDTARRLRGRMPAWEAVANMLSPVFGRAWAWSRLPVVDPVVKDVLRVETPSVVDGSMSPDRWFAGATWPRTTRKIDGDRRAFANLDLTTYDAVYDVASFSADADVLGSDQGSSLRREYEAATRTPISAERWFLLQALHLWDRLRLRDGDESDLRRAISRSAQRYFAEVFIGESRSSSDGPLVALDVDGVLEDEAIGFPSLTRSSALALRALVRHAFRPVLMTGRSLDDVVDRCRTLGFAGGVAEYGSVVYDHVATQSTSMLSEDQALAVARARTAVARLAGVDVDSAYRHSVRAFRINRSGRRRPPDVDVIDAAIEAAGLRGKVEIIAGDSQVDLVAAGVDKGLALRRLRTLLTGAADPIALAVGDGPRDIGAFALAKLSVAPAHAPAEVRAAAARTSRGEYQRGLFDAVRTLIGHQPGGCAVCRADHLDRDRSRLLAVLSAREAGRRSMAAVALRLGFGNALRAVAPLGRRL